MDDNRQVMDVGAIVGRRYAIEAVAGTGGMCSVYRARDRGGGLVAVKSLNEHAVEARERFEREVRMLQDLSHPAIVRYLDSGTENGERFLVMEWLEGSDLETLLAKRTLSLAEVLRLGGRIAGALAAAHDKGIVHRDVKPSNIFVIGDDVSSAKLLDFGVARWGRSSGRALTITGTSVGTPAYMAPEQVRGDRVIDARADVFSLGCVLYECLTGEPAFVAHNPMAVFCKILVDKAPRAAELVPGLPDPIDHLLQAMLAKELPERPANGKAVAAALDDLARNVDVAEVGRRLTKSPRLRNAITGDEQRLVNVIVATAGASTTQMGDARTVRLFPDKVPVVEFAPGQRVNFRFDALSDGSLVALLETGGVATDQAISASRFALAVRQEFPAGDIAIATGLAVVGKARLVGEAIDRACQLLAFDTRTGSERELPRPIRIDEVTAGLIGARFEVGYDAGGPVLLGERPAAAERTLLGRPTPFVGRARETATLTAILDECIEGGMARAILITGQAGSGKSRLSRELLRTIERRGGIELWNANGDPMRSGSALDLMSEAVRRLAGVQGGEPTAVQRQKLRALVTRNVTEAQSVRVGEFLGELLGVPSTADDSLPLRAARQDPILMGDQVRGALEDLLDAHTAAHPVVLLLEDLHWGDQATIALIDRALRNLAERPLLVVALARPELHDLFPRIWSAHNMTEVRLGPLPRRAARELAEAVLGAGVPPERVTELVERAEGNPFYLEELVRTAAAGDWELPDTLVAMMQARLEALEPEARRVLRAASVYGGLFWRGGVLALVGEKLAAERWMDILIERELLSAAEDTRFAGERAFRFRHELVRDAAYALLLEDDKKLGHSLAGEWLERAGETDARALAEHFDRADSPDRALPYYLRGAETALERGDFAAVLELCDRAEKCNPDTGDLGILRVLQGDARYWRGEHTAAERLYVDAMVLLQRGSRRWYQSVGQLMVVWSTSDAIDRMETLARILAADDDPTDDRVGRTVAQAITAGRLYLSGRTELGDDVLADAEVGAGDLAGADAVVAASIHRARAARGLIKDADPSSFLVEMERCARRFEEIGDAREVCFQRANVAYAYLELGFFAEAERRLRTEIATAERMALDHVANAGRQNLGIALARQGKVRDALAMEQRVLTWAEERRDRRLASAAHCYTALILHLDGDLERAEAEARAALSHIPRDSRGPVLAVLSRILVSAGKTAEALERAIEADHVLADRPVLEGEALVRLSYAEALHAARKTAAARAAITLARDRLLVRAGRMTETSWRQSFLENVPDNARTIALAQRWT